MSSVCFGAVLVAILWNNQMLKRSNDQMISTFNCTSIKRFIIACTHFPPTRFHKSGVFVNSPSNYISHLMRLRGAHFGFAEIRWLQISHSVESLNRITVWQLTWRQINIWRKSHNTCMRSPNIFGLKSWLLITHHK